MSPVKIITNEDLIVDRPYCEIVGCRNWPTVEFFYAEGHAWACTEHSDEVRAQLFPPIADDWRKEL